MLSVNLKPSFETLYIMAQLPFFLHWANIILLLQFMGIFVVNIPPFSLCSFKRLTMQMKSVLLACGLHSIIDVSELQFLALNCSENTWLFQDRNTAGVFLALWTITVPYETSYPPPIPTYTHRKKHSVTPPIPLLSHNRHTPTYTIYVRTPTHRQTHVHTNPNPST